MVNYDFLSVYFYSVPNLRFPIFHFDWNENYFGNICTIRSGIGFKADEYVEQGVPLLKIDNVGYGNIKWNNISYLPETYLKQYPFLKLNENDIVLALNRPITNNQLKISKLTSKDIPSILYQRVGKINVSSDYNLDYIYYLLTKNVFDFVLKTSIGSDQPFISTENLKKLIMKVPTITEQQKIGHFLSLIDQRIQTQIKIIDTLSSQKKQIRNLIFKDIHKNVNCCIQDYVVYEQPQKYIVHSTDYLSYGKDYIPVLTANQSFILGYTLEKDGIYEKGDCIIFDDFTNENKYVDFPFKVKSSALKILQTKEGLMLKFFYEYLQFLKFESTDHKRHYLSEVAVTDINVPNLKEQTFVCKVFNSFDSKLKNEEALLEKYRLQKQFLLNNLFI